VETPLIPIQIETDRLVLRRPSEEDAIVRRELWTERDPRVPPHRRIGPDGRPTVEEIAALLRAEREAPRSGLLTIVRKRDGDIIGYCGLIFDGTGPPDEPELAYELLRRAHGFGYATEAARAVLDWAAEAGYRRVWSGAQVEWCIAPCSAEAGFRRHRAGRAGCRVRRLGGDDQNTSGPSPVMDRVTGRRSAVNRYICPLCRRGRPISPGGSAER